jgi:hypothetical protein
MKIETLKVVYSIYFVSVNSTDRKTHLIYKMIIRISASIKTAASCTYLRNIICQMLTSLDNIRRRLYKQATQSQH